MPAHIIHEGRLSNLQLEAIVYGCQRHLTDLPKESYNKPMPKATGAKPEAKPGVKPEAGATAMDVEFSAEDSAPGKPAYRTGFLLGDGAGMGKGRTLAGFVVENIARGRKKHCWVSVSVDLYEDAKRDLRDLGLGNYAEEKCHNLKSVNYDERFVETATKKKKKGKKGGAGSSSKYDEGGKPSILRAIMHVAIFV